MKKLFNIIIAVCLLANSVYSAPSMSATVGSAGEFTQEETNIAAESNASTTEDKKAPAGPSMQASVLSAEEEGSDDKPSNVLEGDAFLMFSIYEDGDGSAEAPYEIGDAEQLQYFADMVNTGFETTCHYKLVADIDLEGKEWTPVGYYNNATQYATTFKGVFDGNGHTISNFRITKAETIYTGFFGLIFNAQIKNLTLDNGVIDAQRLGSVNSYSYAGILAGRASSDGIGGFTSIKNCHVTNSSINFVSDKETYAGGLIGNVVSGAGSEFEIFNTSAHCDINLVVSSTDYANPDALLCHNAAAGGHTGYIGAVTDSTVTLRKSHSSGNVTVSTDRSDYTSPFAGGFIGQAATRQFDKYGNLLKGGTMYITSCYATGNATSDGGRNVFSAGFCANSGTTYNMYIYDCYASGNAYGSTDGINPDTDYVASAGFIGQIDFDVQNYKDSIPKPIYNCYSTGDAIDTYWEIGKSIDSYCGSFTGYAFAPVFTDVYGLESQTVIAKHPNTSEDVIRLCAEQAVKEQGYPTFDFGTVWQIDENASYPYPTLVEKYGLARFYSQGKLVAENYFGEDGFVTPADVVPSKKENAEYTYSFSHWSLTEDGEAFDFENTAVTEDTSFHAVFVGTKKTYSITFMSEGKVFGTPLSFEYGAKVVPMEEIPQKAETKRYRYEFDYWSLSEGGEKVDLSSYTVKGNDEFYAVFIEIDKTAWNGAVTDSFSEGHGSKTMPYIISSAEEFALLAKVVNEGDTEYEDAYFVLGADINLGYNLWTPIGTKENPFSAHFDGRGYSISRFNIEKSPYMGLFGYVVNAEISNLYISDFSLSADNYSSDENVYAGGLAGYITCSRANTAVNGIYVNAARFEITTNAPSLYAGNIAGFVDSYAGTTRIKNSYALNDITAVANGEKSTVHAGGLFGYMSTNAGGALAIASECYYIGSVTSYGKVWCIAGGLAGTVHSHGSAYSPGYKPGLLNEAADYDIMLENCFVSANVKASSGSENLTTAYAGAVAGEVSQYAGTNNVFYKRSTQITPAPTLDKVHGVSASEANLISKSFVSSTVGFDFANTWTYIEGNDYPVLKVMYSDKPMFRLGSLEYEDGTINASITVYAKVPHYTVTVAVYNERNQLVASKRTRLALSDIAHEFDVSFSSIESADRVQISAIDSSTFVPLFPVIEQYL